MGQIVIGKNLETGKEFHLDIKTLLKSRLLVQANSGGGKSWLLRKIMEETHGKVQQIILDPEDDFSTLREKYDFVLAGKGGDISVDPRTAEVFAHKILELRADVIINLYELKKHDRVRFVKLFLEAMVNAPKSLWHPALIFLDEAHDFAPEKTKSESLGAVIDMESRGRKRGFCLIPATQRPAKLDKDVAAECRNKLVGFANISIDRKRAAEELGLVGREEILELRDMQEGEFFAIGPAFPRGLNKIKIGMVKTTHHEAGEVAAKHTKPVATSKVKKILSKLIDLPQEAEQELHDKQEMKSRIRELERELRETKKAVKVETKIEKVVDPKAIKKAQDEFKAEFMREFANSEATLYQAISDFGRSLRKSFGAVAEQLKKSSAMIGQADHLNRVQDRMCKSVLVPIAPKKKETAAETSDDARRFGRCERAIVKFLAMRQGHSFNKTQIAVMTQYSPTSGGFNNSLSNLVQAGMIYRQGDKISLSDGFDARSFLGDDYLAPEADSLVGWLSKLPKCERHIFDTLKSNQGAAFTKDQIAQQTGYSATSGGFNNAVSKLNTLGLIQRNRDGTIELNKEIIDV